MTALGPVQVDGSFGEGGGQILRTSIALSMLTGRTVELDRVRAGRRRPGLRRQHLTGVLAAAEVCGASVDGAALGSTRLRFAPGPVRPGALRFDVGTAGSTALVLQALLPALWAADAPSTIEIVGGTHALGAPPFEFLARCFAPVLADMGASIELELVQHGFFPAGGGVIRARVRPASWRPLRLVERGVIRELRPVAVVSNLPTHIAAREAEVLCEGLGLPASSAEVREVASAGPGNACWVEVEAEHVIGVFSAVGRRGVRAERVASEVVEQARGWLDLGVPVGPHLADQLLLPLAIGAGGVFRTGPLTRHSETNLAVIARFLDVPVEVRPIDDDLVEVQVGR